jgi:hypothetical protein
VNLSQLPKFTLLKSSYETIPRSTTGCSYKTLVVTSDVILLEIALSVFLNVHVLAMDKIDYDLMESGKLLLVWSA